MHRPSASFLSHLGAALTGGVVAAAIGLAAVAAGWVGDDDSGSTSLAAAPLTESASEGDEKGLTVGEIYRRDSKGVAFIQARSSGGAATGSGFVIDDDGHVLTNAHVVEGADEIQVTIGDEENARDAELVGIDPSSDVALLEVNENDDLQPLELGDSSQVEVGDPVVAIGNPFGLDRTVTSGIVSAKQRQIQAPNGFSISDVIQTDAAVNPGNSGGPLLDSSGRVIGINSQIATDSGGNDGVAFAVPIETAKEVSDQLLADGSVERAYLGISGGPADEAGLKGATGQAAVQGQAVPAGGDIITAIDGEEIAGMEDVISMVNAAKPGDEVTLTVIRDGEQQDLKLTLGERPAQIEDASAPSIP